MFLARQSGPDGFAKQVVIKKLLPHLAEDPRFVKMFLQEARVAALMNHPNVVSIYDLGQGEEPGTYFIAMEYLEGCNLIALQRSYVDRHGTPLPAAHCAQIAADACAGLDFAHNLAGTDGQPLHLVHRDISPDNLFVTTTGTVKVLDFGIAKPSAGESLTQAGQVKGKWGYLPPELIAGQPVDRRVDIWSLGVTLYWLAAGKPPFPGASEAEMLHRILNAEPPPFDDTVPPALQQVILKALAKDPSGRYATARDMQEALEQWVGSQTPPLRRSAAVLSELVRTEIPRPSPAVALAPEATAAPAEVTAPGPAQRAPAAARVPLHTRVTVPAEAPELPAANRLARLASWVLEVGVALTVLRLTYVAMPSAAFTALLLLSVASFSVRHASPGQLLFGLTLVARDGLPAPLPQALARFALVHGWLFCVSIFLGLVYSGGRSASVLGLAGVGWGALLMLGSLAALGSNRLALHDRITGLRVVRRRKTT